MVYRLRHHDHITDSFATLHWLRLPERVDFKVDVTAFPVLHAEADLGMFCMFGRTGAPQKGAPTRGHGPKITILLRNIQ